MKKPLLVLLLGAALVWSCTMFIHARADEAPATPEKPWSIAVEVRADDGSDNHVLLGWYRVDKEHAIEMFDTEASCKAFLKSDKKIAAVKAKVDAQTAQWKPPGHTVWTCKLRDTSI